MNPRFLNRVRSALTQKENLTETEIIHVPSLLSGQKSNKINWLEMGSSSF